MTKTSTILKTEIFDITDANLTDKLSEHIQKVVNSIKINQYKDIKITTRIDELSEHTATITMEVENMLNRKRGKK